MIKSTIRELLEIVGTEYSWEEGKGHSDCPIHRGVSPKSFHFNNYIGRCSVCGWVGNSAELVTGLELYCPSEERRKSNIPRLSTTTHPAVSREAILKYGLAIARVNVLQDIDALEELAEQGKLKDALATVEINKRWSRFLDYADHLNSELDTILLKEVQYESR